jgi:hypothetical protein
MRNLKVQSSGELYGSFVFNVVNSAQGDLTKIEFAFNYYGSMQLWVWQKHPLW